MPCLRIGVCTTIRWLPWVFQADTWYTPGHKDSAGIAAYLLRSEDVERHLAFNSAAFLRSPRCRCSICGNVQHMQANDKATSIAAHTLIQERRALPVLKPAAALRSSGRSRFIQASVMKKQGMTRLLALAARHVPTIRSMIILSLLSCLS